VEMIFVYAGLVNAITSFILGAIVLGANYKASIARWFSLSAFGITYWSIHYALWLQAGDAAQVLMHLRHSLAGSIVIPTAFLIFTHRFLDKKNPFIEWLSGMLGGCLMFTVFTPYFIRKLHPVLFFDYWPVPAFFAHVMMVYFMVSAAYAFTVLWQSLRAQDGVKRNQTKYVFFGTLIGFAGGATNYLLWYGIPVPPYLNILVSLYVFIAAYAIARYRLMNIHIILRRVMVAAGLFALVLCVFMTLRYLLTRWLGGLFGFGAGWASAVSLFVLVFAYEDMRKLLINATDRFLFQKNYNYQKILKDASAGLSKIESLDHLLRLVVHFVTMKMRISNAGILTRLRDSDEYLLCYQRGYEKNYLEYRLKPSDALIAYLSREKEAVNINRVQEYMQSGVRRLKKNRPFEAYDFQAVYDKMKELKAVSCVPSFLGKTLQNVLVLGDKKSGDLYTDEDMSILYTLAQESAIAIENARLYDEAVNKSYELERINEQLEYSKGLLINALRETEVANKQLKDTQAQLIHEQKMATLGRLAASVGHEVNNPLTILSMNVSRAILKYRKDPGLKVGEILELFSKMEQNIGRIKAVVNTLTGLLKRSEKGKFEPLSLKIILEETLPLVQFQTYLDNLTGTQVEFDIPGNIPLIKGDLERLQEVFLNLFINAYHAMEGRRNRRIAVSAKIDTGDDRFITVRFADNGCGMSEEVMAKIFNYGYTTKPPGRGSGMGLYMCKYIIELHGGSMAVESKAGEGTTFILKLPVYEEENSASEQPVRKATG